MAIERKTLIYRLKYYGFGFALGCIVVYFSLIKDRERPAWMPEGRVLEFLADTEIIISDQLECELNCHNLTVNFMDTTFWKNAIVDFDKSEVDRKPCPEHFIKTTLDDGREFGVFIENCEKCIDCEEEGVATLRSIVNLSEKDKECDC